MKENKRRGVADSRLRSREREPSAGARLIVQTMLSFSSSSASSAPSPPSSPPRPQTGPLRPSTVFIVVVR
ncbi:hypothetical protein HETIRDRAFT_447493 [Heterobasidion irregulare TC 32-1]|uniref:Uncharacterized protein n=1 Tax=Heterobasidion irregulare (strain TC 32-1) TaxID=747525 RepID=W4KN88_HETIT|nr:uncharacterized protein HETIRDRAFT_447493 [Heterobasidion irregulare TC 32-1]ETW86840.1 hypothetical protein HETIRDRAFT_447493 [Heterobasidion irregulare TC 32-1]